MTNTEKVAREVISLAWNRGWNSLEDVVEVLEREFAAREAAAVEQDLEHREEEEYNRG